MRPPVTILVFPIGQNLYVNFSNNARYHRRFIQYSNKIEMKADKGRHSIFERLQGGGDATANRRSHRACDCAHAGEPFIRSHAGMFAARIGTRRSPGWGPLKVQQRRGRYSILSTPLGRSHYKVRSPARIETCTGAAR